MVVRKSGQFEALCYDATSETPVLRYRGKLSINSRPYLVHVEQGSDGSVCVDLAAGDEDDAFFNFVLCSQGLVAIHYQDDTSLSQEEFMKKSGIPASDVSGLAKLLGEEARALFGSCSSNIPASLKNLSSEPAISRFKAVLHKTLEPLLEKLSINPEYRDRIYNSVVSSYVKVRDDGVKHQ